MSTTCKNCIFLSTFLFSISSFIFILIALHHTCSAELADASDSQRLYEDLMREYNPLARPVGNSSAILELKMGIQLSQIIDINMKYQVLSTKVWVLHEWTDHSLRWDPEEYGGISRLHIPSEDLWLPDLVLYNNADGDYHITRLTKATVFNNGSVRWRPPAIYKSSCQIDVEYFPFDEQKCFLRIGTWSYDGYVINLTHIVDPNAESVEYGIDLARFYPSSEWDVIDVPARKHVIIYACCPNEFMDIRFNLTVRRKTLFYTVNLIVPCVAISALCIVVFYLPSDSGEKISLSISIMVSLVVFFLLLSEILPPTSLGIPLLGRYLIFTLVLVTLSVCLTILVLNINFRSPSTHHMAPWVKKFFLDILPRLLNMQRPKRKNGRESGLNMINEYPSNCDNHCFNSHLIHDGSSAYRNLPSSPPKNRPPQMQGFAGGHSLGDPHAPLSATIESMHDVHLFHHHHPDSCPGKIDASRYVSEYYGFSEGALHAHSKTAQYSDIQNTLLSIQFVAQHMENLDSYYEVEEDWKYVALVMDRLFLWIFSISCVLGTIGIIAQAPTLYDDKEPIDIKLSKIAQKYRPQIL